MTTASNSSVRIAFDQRIPMRDDVTLSADIYFPPGAPVDGSVRYPALVSRTPYVKASTGTLESARYYAEHGYVFVAQDVRGRGDSDGNFVPYFHDGRDGFDTIEWCAAQPWSNGSVGTTGGSYLGHIQWLTALRHPPHLKAMAVMVTPSDPFVETPTGLPGPMHLCWLHFVSGHMNQPMEAVDWTQIYDHLPIVSMDERAGRRNEHWRLNIAHPQLDDYWDPLCYQRKFATLDVPVFHISGWYDDEQIGTPLNYIGMTTHAASPEARAGQRLLMGPWGHQINTTARLGELDFGPQSIIDLRANITAWFDRWLKDTPVDTSERADAPVRIFVMGANAWRDEHEWPLARTQWTPYYLRGDGRANSRFGDGALSTAKPPASEPADTYRYDPARPVPFITEPTSLQIGGPDDYTAIERRDDVLVYVTAPLAAAVEVTGPIRVDLYASSSAPDTDFMAKLVDVWPTGFTQRLCDGMVRARFRDGMEHPTLIQPATIYHYTIDCWNTAQVFKAGHRIGIEIASSAFPKYDRNPNTGAELGQTTELAVADQRIYHDAEHPSAVVLPIIPA